MKIKSETIFKCDSCDVEVTVNGIFSPPDWAGVDTALYVAHSDPTKREVYRVAAGDTHICPTCRAKCKNGYKIVPKE